MCVCVFASLFSVYCVIDYALEHSRRSRFEIRTEKLKWYKWKSAGWVLGSRKQFCVLSAQIQFPFHIQAAAHKRMADTLTVAQNNNFIAVESTFHIVMACSSWQASWAGEAAIAVIVSFRTFVCDISWNKMETRVAPAHTILDRAHIHSWSACTSMPFI